MVTRPFMCGSFTWTGFDYKGEPNPYGWPDVSNNTGLLDAVRLPERQMLLFRILLVGQADGAFAARWLELAGQGGTEHPRDGLQQCARRSNCSLTARVWGPKTCPTTAMWNGRFPISRANWWPKATRDGKLVATRHGANHRRARPHRAFTRPDHASRPTGKTPWWCPVSILDAQGRVVPDAGNRVSLPASPAAAGFWEWATATRAITTRTGPTSATPFTAIAWRSFRRVHSPAALQLTATSPGLTSASTTFQTR